MWPTGNVRSIQRFAASLLNASTTGDVANIVGTLNAGLDGVCSPERFTPSRLTPASCRSGEVELRLVPGECLLAPTTGELVCRPAYLLLEQRPAECSLPWVLCFFFPALVSYLPSFFFMPMEGKKKRWKKTTLTSFFLFFSFSPHSSPTKLL